MPGIVGLVSAGHLATVVPAMAHRLVHFPWMGVDAVSVADTLGLCVVHRKDRTREYEVTHHDSGAITLVLFGAAFLTGHGRLDARAILARWLHDSFDRWHDLDGSFLAVIVDRRSSTLHIANDRSGQLPLFYAARSGLFAFAPEAKALFELPEVGLRLSRAGVINFLVAGHGLGDETMFEGIKQLEPSTHLAVDLRTAEVRSRTLWTHHYQEDVSLRNQREINHRLNDAVNSSHELLLADDPQKVALFLSGGWDSRGILCALDSVGRLPNYTQTWGLRADIPHSDPAVAARLAQRFGVEHRFSAYDTDTFVHEAAEWAWLSELSIDNPGWFAEGAGMIIRQFDHSTDVFLEGHEVWGACTQADNEAEAIAGSLPPAPQRRLNAVLTESGAHETAEAYESQLERISRRFTNDDPKDRRDLYYNYGRLPRRILTWGHFKELVAPQRRPLLANAVLDLVLAMPASKRLRKIGYRTMLLHNHRKARHLPVAWADSLPDWNHDLRKSPELRAYFWQLLDPARITGGALDGLVDPAAVEKLRHDYFTSTVLPVDRSRPLRKSVSELVQRPPVLEALRLRGHPPKPEINGGHDADVVRRLALLSLFEGEIQRRGTIKPRVFTS